MKNRDDVHKKYCVGFILKQRFSDLLSGVYAGPFMNLHVMETLVKCAIMK